MSITRKVAEIRRETIQEDLVDDPYKVTLIPDGELYIAPDGGVQKASFDRLNGDVRRKVEELLNSDKPPGFKNAVELVRNPERLVKECSDGNIWYVESDGDVSEEYICDDDPITIPVKTIVRMPPLIFAVYAKEYKAADRLLSINEFSDFTQMLPVRFLSAGKWTTVCGDEFRLVKEEKYSHLDRFILGAYGRWKDSAPLPLCHRLLERYGEKEYYGWLNLNKGNYSPGANQDGNHRMHNTVFDSCQNDYRVQAFELLRYILEADAELFTRMMNEETFFDLLIHYFLHLNLNGRKEDLRTFRKMYKAFGECYYDDVYVKVSEKPMEENLWHELAARCISDQLGFIGIGETIDKETLDLGRIWKAVSGRRLYFDMDSFEFEKENQLPFPGGAGFMSCSGILNNKGLFTGLFLEMIIRNSTSAVYGNSRGQTGQSRYDLDYLIEDLGEEIVLMALKKDFIRRKDADYLISLARQKNKGSLIPALILKKHGEWPPADVCEDGNKRSRADAGKVRRGSK